MATHARNLALTWFRDAAKELKGEDRLTAEDRAAVEKHIIELVNSEQQQNPEQDDTELASYAVETACHDFNLGGCWQYEPMRYTFEP